MKCKKIHFYNQNQCHAVVEKRSLPFDIELKMQKYIYNQSQCHVMQWWRNGLCRLTFGIWNLEFRHGHAFGIDASTLPPLPHRFDFLQVRVTSDVEHLPGVRQRELVGEASHTNPKTKAVATAVNCLPLFVGEQGIGISKCATWPRHHAQVAMMAFLQVPPVLALQAKTSADSLPHTDTRG